MDLLTKAADDYADEADRQHELTFIAKSNGIRKATKEKIAELNVVDSSLLQSC
jgi:hypothetical protein